MHYAQVPESVLRRKVTYSANDDFQKKEEGMVIIKYMAMIFVSLLRAHLDEEEGGEVDW